MASRTAPENPKLEIHHVCLQVSFLAFIGPMSSATPNPTFVTLGRAFDNTPVQASYQLVVYLVFSGVGPLFVVPFASTTGRRPIVVLGSLIGAVMNILAGYCSTWAGIIVTRVFSGFAVGATVSLGPAIICDMYFLHERGFYMGIFALFINNGPHIAPLIGGFISRSLGWRYCFAIPGYIQLGVFVVVLFTFPETYFRRYSALNSESVPERSFLSLFSLRLPSAFRKEFHLRELLGPFEMARYVCVLVPNIYYMTCMAYGSVLFATTGSVVYTTIYGFNIVQVGLILSIPLLVGNLLGEATAGWFVDWLVYRHAKKHNGVEIPEARLDALWLALALPVGTIINGVCISHSATTSWVGNAIGMAISSVGFQVATTVTYTYCTDCYRSRSAEVGTVINFTRHIFSALVSFDALPLAEDIGFQYAWLVFSFINIILLVPFLLLRIFGQKMRMSDSKS
ncbi:hypothetical protein J7T55_003065 [Diaporthe amygdali]|uniref:uncharacterized protein n=1 Tax=Phomopsis amygdali TaxID=1214568 RepID=UPI0022FF1DB2|nr:uncharacterized protein J7T55_003065 [Diaporthe amygdali]KAJ0122551.1 hypothetical protein J7T55_003065 [Diaporthe amygdali]